MRRWVLGIAALLALAAPAAHAAGAKKAPAKPAAKPAAKSGAPTQSDEQIADALKAFCHKWMGFLETRERDNKHGVKWQNTGAGVKGQYTGYSTDYDCTLKERSSNGTPIATIVYKEYVYETTGATQDAALAATPTVVDATEVTEIFRFTKGEWVY
jgi:hypothetical protein